MPRFAIGPSIGVARLGNSPDDFYIEPDAAGALPIVCDHQGNVSYVSGEPERVRLFKDDQGRVKRQGALFRVYEIGDGGASRELTMDSPDVASISWTVHLANKKACWYNFSGLQGDLLYGDPNSYDNTGVPLRNADKKSVEDRRGLIIDFGPASLSGRSKRLGIDAELPKHTGYAFASWPRKKVAYGSNITKLGDLVTDDCGRLVVLGGYGLSGGDANIASFAGADTWHDDVSDGQIECELVLKTGDKHLLSAWCIVGSPKFVPEIVNVVSLDDTAYDAAIRNLDADPRIFSNGRFDEEYRPNFDRDVRPILDRPGAYRWVANMPAMNSVSPPPFDPRDASSATAAVRASYLTLFREPSPQASIGAAANTLFNDDGFPMIPLNSGSNSVFNQPGLIDKFLTLTLTQHFFLKQWSLGRFEAGPPPAEDEVTKLTKASLGNCVGGPFCPGIEVTWSTRNPRIYKALRQIATAHPLAWYDEHGLTPGWDETTAHDVGCEPGDLTKRMAIPWQSDFFQCSIQYINFTDPKSNKGNGIPTPPTYYAYWWPPQSPWQVMTGDLTAEGQASAGTPAGYQVLYARGINTFNQMIDHWSYMGFVVNQVRSPFRDLFPNFAEQERNHAAFVTAAIAVGDATNVVTGSDSNFANAWFLPATVPEHAPHVALDEAPAQPPRRLAGAAVSFGTSRRQGRTGT